MYDGTCLMTTCAVTFGYAEGEAFDSSFIRRDLKRARNCAPG